MKELWKTTYSFYNDDDPFAKSALYTGVVIITLAYLIGLFKLGIFIATALFIILIVPVGLPLCFIINFILNIAKIFYVRKLRKATKSY